MPQGLEFASLLHFLGGYIQDMGMAVQTGFVDMENPKWFLKPPRAIVKTPSQIRHFVTSPSGKSCRIHKSGPWQATTGIALITLTSICGVEQFIVADWLPEFPPTVKIIKYMTRLCTSIRRDRWFSRTWVFQERYSASFRMYLSDLFRTQGALGGI
jgi:hypothetical protein